jgi:hypothetical protein
MAGFSPIPLFGGTGSAVQEKKPAVVRALFLYPSSSRFSGKPDGWWSWPGNDFDAEGRQKEYMAEFQKIEKKLGMKIAVEPKPVESPKAAAALAEKISGEGVDGLLLVQFYNRSMKEANTLLAAAEKANLPVVYYIGLGVKHGSIADYRRPGVYFIQSLDNFEALEYGMRMIHARKRMSQMRMLSVTGAKEPREVEESFLGTKLRIIPFSQYSDEFKKVELGPEAEKWMEEWRGEAKEIRGVTNEARQNSARAHFALKKLLVDEQADGVTMTCLRGGMLKPCMSFASLNGMLIPAACENDHSALFTQMIGQLLTERPGFQHNPAFETERNHYYGSHCTCPTRVTGPKGKNLPYLLRRFAHTNEGSCAIQVFWNPGDPVTMVHYHPGKEPALDVYAGRVVVSHPMPPAGGCTTNVEVEITDRADACMVKGRHNQLFCGDFARKFRLFAQLFKLKLVESGFNGPWPG